MGRLPLVLEVVRACGYKVEDTDHPGRMTRAAVRLWGWWQVYKGMVVMEQGIAQW